MNGIKLEFSFKGDRNYVHGTDIYKQIVKGLTTLGYVNWQLFELNIRKIGQYNMICFLADRKHKIEGEVINFVLKRDQEQLYGSITENDNSKIASRYSFNENDITRHCIIDYNQESITYNNSQNTFATIDIVISLSKFYLENAIDNNVKWFFRSVKFLRPIDNIEYQQIWVKKILQKRNIVGFDVYAGDQLIGQAYGASSL